MSNVIMKLRGVSQLQEARVNQENTVEINQRNLQVNELSFDVPVSGTVYGTLLNYQGAYKAFESQMHEKPYKAPPKKPVLYIKPKNTFASHGAAIPLPEGVSELQMGAALGLVIGKTAKQVKADEALEYMKGFTVVNDVSIPHESVHRPAVKEKARDGFCPMGPWVMEREAITDPDALNIRVFINDELKQENNTKHLIRSIGTLMADVTEFMTLYAGDVLLVGVPENAPLAKENDVVKIEMEGVGTLKNTIKKENDVVGGDII
ncbi:fumarylacetoacetate hydrolase family protein [Virgibacillus alimentarius]|uniref:5-oxopent-3-ene-1,2,5-tricarboxylate decarboxylase/2-hydroxyhepta-2,4-diene-1,7-dioate isomerase n=1 Tax=Virgibacillus alimentarius TaxID=698769 RepID=A0ABS4S9M7_9BACI|nr:MULTISPECIES: fumarylacetoacetate hydrolase family protein [Virgibacillus]MBP2258213.1 5-oxopent-3-ene-1,2,5-tricarboxylate decarboxylase/2-hydroxyhepta-2,4-diene-1,7-dioate isomerase [Virgibacillus alimentarius]HLR69620.1 fumarylacetoacetate hydrolase family protein [Virgibacillus sp.]